MTSEVQLPFFTIFIPVRNEEKFIECTLDQLYKQTYPKDRFEVIVSDGLSTDTTRELVESYIAKYPEFNLSIFDNPKQLSSAGRNIAVQNGKGDYFLLIDGHVHIDSDTLIEDHAKAAQSQEVLVFGRPQPLSPPGISPFQKAISVARASPIAHSGESYIYSDFEGWVSPISVATGYHRKVFDDHGYFDENFDAAEDYEFNYRLERAGLKCFISTDFQVSYYPRSDFKSLFKQLTRYGYGRALFLNKHPSRISLENFVPAAFVLTLLALLIGSFFHEWFCIALIAILALYSSIQLLNSVYINLKKGTRYFFKVPAIITCIHFGLGYGFLKGLFSVARKNAKA